MEVGGSNNFEGAMPRTILEAVMAAAVIEKRTVSLPTVRVPETLETALLRLAARDDRTFGHVGSLPADGEGGQ